jgi:hypothetical protein
MPIKDDSTVVAYLSTDDLRIAMQRLPDVTVYETQAKLVTRASRASPIIRHEWHEKPHNE